LSGAGSSPPGKPGVEVLQSLLETDLGRVQFTHRPGQPVLGEVVRLDPTGHGDELHRSHRGTIVALGEHVDVSVGHALAVELARPLGQHPIAEALLLHEEPERLTEGPVAV
jgi:hypothetical protein